MAKIEANLRRERRAQGAGATQKRPRLYFGEIALDLRARCVQVGDVQLALTKHEYAVVEFLALHPGQIFSREQIYERVWGYDAEGSADVVAMRSCSNSSAARQTPSKMLRFRCFLSS